MAAMKFTSQHGEIDVDDTRYGYRRFFGTRDAFVREGLAQADWFPGEPGRGSTRQSVIFNEDGGADLVRIQGAGITRVANGRRWLFIQKQGRRFMIQRPYWPGEEPLEAAAIARHEKEDSWTPTSLTAYELERAISRQPAGLTPRQEKQWIEAKIQFHAESFAKFRDDVERESGEDFDDALYMFSSMRFIQIMSSLRGNGRDDDDRGGGGSREPEPKPAPTPTAA